MSSPSVTSPRYRVVGRFGQGGMGVVLRVFDSERGEYVAQKRILEASAMRMLRFKREFRAVAELDHPNLVRLYELAEDEQGLFYTMEAVDGVDLLSYCWGADADEATTTIAESSQAGTATDSTDTGSGAFVSGSIGLRAGCDLAAILDRLRVVLPQIVSALDHLHTRGLVHRDLKPHNILVTRTGVAKLLDFGVLADLRANRRRRREIVGTLSYMAPEQLAGQAITPAADLYALGAVLFRVTSGHHVFEGASAQVKRDLATRPAPRLSSLLDDVPPWLDDACLRLLDKNPAARPDLGALCHELLEPLGAELPALGGETRARGAVQPAQAESGLVGRADLQRRLQRFLGGQITSKGPASDRPGRPGRQGEPAVRSAGAGEHLIALTGPTGAGKSALASWLAREAESSDMLVLRGRCRPSERVPFNAIDGMVDELAVWLGARSAPRPVAILARVKVAASVFPVLGRRADPAPRRSAAFDALIQLIEYAAASERGALLVIDDLQWADADSLAFLQRLLEWLDRGPGAAPVRVVATLREDVAEGAARAWVDAWAARSPAIACVAVTPLDSVAITDIILTVARDGGHDADPAAVARLADACAGRPYLAEVAGRALAGGRAGDEDLLASTMVSTLVESAPPLAKRLLALLLAADGWLGVADLADVAFAPAGSVLDALAGLERTGLVRRAGPPTTSGQADIYHDAVRPAAQAALGSQAIIDAHAALGDFLARGEQPQFGRQVRHLLGAGCLAEAAALAPRAAEQAEKTHAFGLAAEMYAIVLAHGQPARPGEGDAERRALLRRYAGVLENGGRYHDAAAAWYQLASIAAGDEKVDAALNEAAALMAANDISGGHARLEHALRAAGEPAIGGGKLAGLIEGIGFLLGPRSPARPRRAATDVDAIRTRAANDVRLGELLGYFEPIAGIRYLRRAQRAFSRAGDRENEAWIDYLFAYFAMFASPRRGPVPLSERYLLAGDERVRGLECENYEIRALPPLVRGVTASRDARWDEADRQVSAALDIAQQSGLVATFGHMFAAIHRAQIALGRQHVPGAAAIQAWLRGVARESHDSAILCHVEFAQVQLDMYRGRLVTAAGHGENLAKQWPGEQPTFQRFLAEVWRAAPHIYCGDCHLQRQKLADALVHLRRLRPLGNMYCGMTGAVIALVEANALLTGDRQASRRRIARLARMCAKAPPRLAPGGLRALAYVTDDPERAVALLARAAGFARDTDQPIDAAIADYQRGLLLGGSAGKALQDQARRDLDDVGASPVLLDECARHR